MIQYNLFMCMARTLIILDSFTYLGSLVRNSRLSGHEIFRLSGLVHAVINSLITSIKRGRKTNFLIFKSFGLPLLLYGFDTLTITRDLEEASEWACFRRIVEYRWFDRVSDQ